MNCADEKFPLCSYCADGQIFGCTLHFYEVYFDVLKHAPEDEIRDVLVDRAKRKHTKHIVYVLKKTWPERHDWFERLLLLK